MHPSRLEGAAPPLAALKEEINLKLTISYNFYTLKILPLFLTKRLNLEFEISTSGLFARTQSREIQKGKLSSQNASWMRRESFY